MNIQELSKIIALWAAAPTAIVALVGIVAQWLVGRKQAAAAGQSAAAANLSATAANNAAAAASEVARLKQIELDRDAVKFLSMQRREDLAATRKAVVDFYSLVFSRQHFSAVDLIELRRSLGEIEFRVLPNKSTGEELLVAARNVAAHAQTNNVADVSRGRAAFITAAQNKFHDDLRLIEKQVEVGKL